MPGLRMTFTVLVDDPDWELLMEQYSEQQLVAMLVNATRGELQALIRDERAAAILAAEVAAKADPAAQLGHPGLRRPLSA